MLQKSFVEKLDNLLNPSAPAGGITITFGGANPYASGANSRSDVYSIARAQLVQLRSQVAAAAATNADRMSKIHLQDLAEKIKNALDPK